MKITMQLQVLITSEIFIITVTAQINLSTEGYASQDTTLTVNATSYPAHLAIEGPANNNWDEGCSSTDNGHRTAWWSLLLQKLAFITTINIYYRSGKEITMDNFRLYFTNGSTVDSSKTVFCYKESSPDIPNLNQEITCNIPAKRFFFFNRRSDYTAFVELCYIEIIGCWRGYWGLNCTNSCPIECINQDCFPANGSCVWGCDSHSCFHGTCDTNTKICTTGCVNRRAGRYCTHYNVAYNAMAKQISSHESLPASLPIDGNMTTCISSKSTNYYLQIETVSLSVITMVYIAFTDTTSFVGSYTVYCSNTSDYLIGEKIIHNREHLNEDIQVYGVCRYVTYVPSTVDGVSKQELCEIEIGGCPYKKYGNKCEFSCPSNCVGPCDLVNGYCSFGCLDGWIGQRCDVVCNPGHFGDRCLRTCSNNCILPPCHHVAGECESGCVKGWKGFNCTEECGNGQFGLNCSESCNGCIVNVCDRINGVCSDSSSCKSGYLYGRYCNTTCADWHFGTNCAQMCHCLVSPCNKFNGKCPAEGCKRGWHGESCDKECTPGYYGFNCDGFCKRCFNLSCDIFEGNCEFGCNEAFYGVNCEIQANENNSIGKGNSVSELIGTFTGGVLFGFIVAVIIFKRKEIMSIRTGKRNTTENNQGPDQQYDEHGMENVSAYQDLSGPSIQNTYDQINTEYINIPI